MNFKHAKAFLFLVGILAVLPVAAHASVLDANYVPAEYNMSRAIGTYNENLYVTGQTFTVETTGYLEEVHLILARSGGVAAAGDLDFNLLTTSGGVPTSTSLASSSISYSSLGPGYDWKIFDISAAHVFVTSGQVLALVMSLDNGYASVWRGRNDTDTSTLYAGGMVYQTVNGGAWDDYGMNYDLAFKTYVTAAVPVPAAVWLLGSGLIGLFGLRRKLKN